jgi:pyruvate dehydrogenase E2 component (dihydrolipoamide acetyltransferase)
MPKLGLTMTEGVLASWAVAVGDRVKAGDVLFTVETDKIATEIEAQGDGEILSLEARDGETYPVGAVLGEWTGSGLALDTSAEPPVEPQLPASVMRAPRADGSRIYATPLARRVARNADFDISSVTGSGPNGRIQARDVHAAISAIVTQKQRPVTSRLAVPQLRKIVARRMVEAKQTIPHFYVLANADLAKANDLRAQLNADSRQKISVTHILVAALARAIAEMPEANEIWEDDELIRFGSIDIGVAVTTPRGLLAPVVRNLGERTLDEVAEQTNSVIERARIGALQQNDLTGGAISISNVGMFGVAGLIPIVNPGQSSILGVGCPEQLFRPDANGQPRLCEELRLFLSCDHRVWDGARAAQFLDRVRTLLERPLVLLRS